VPANSFGWSFPARWRRRARRGARDWLCADDKPTPLTRPSGWRGQVLTTRARLRLAGDRIPTRTGAVSKRLTDQEQIQIIVTAIGTPKPSALRIARTNSESKFAWGRTSGRDMTLLLGAPRASARPQDELSIASSDQDPDDSSIAGMLRGYG